jgi:uncharacterized protein YpuA (DUF1002 family)
MWPFKKIKDKNEDNIRKILRNTIEQYGWSSLSQEELTSVFEIIKEQNLINRIIDYLQKYNP